MRVKYGKFYALWRDENRKQHEKACRTKREAERFQQDRRDEIRAVKLKGANTVKRLAVAWFEAHSRFQDRRDRWASQFCAQEMIRVAGDSNVSELHWFIPNGLIDEWKTKPAGRKQPYATATLFTLRFRLKNLLAWFVDHGANQELVKKLQKTPIPQARQIIAEAWQIEQLKAIAPPWMKCFLLLCLDGGLRTTEALNICPANYSAATGRFVLEVKKRRVKNFDASEELKAVLASAPLPDSPETPFVSLLRGQSTGDHIIYPFFKKMLEQIGAQPSHTPRGLTWLHPHDLRRTMATWMYWKTKNLRQVQEYLGHAHAVTTLRYIIHANTAEILPILEELKEERKREAVIQVMRRKGAGA
jgi:integrase